MHVCLLVGGHPHNWNAISQECLSLLSDLTQRLVAYQDTVATNGRPKSLSQGSERKTSSDKSSTSLLAPYRNGLVPVVPSPTLGLFQFHQGQRIGPVPGQQQCFLVPLLGPLRPHWPPWPCPSLQTSTAPLPSPPCAAWLLLRNSTRQVSAPCKALMSWGEAPSSGPLPQVSAHEWDAGCKIVTSDKGCCLMPLFSSQLLVAHLAWTILPWISSVNLLFLFWYLSWHHNGHYCERNVYFQVLSKVALPFVKSQVHV